MTIDKKSLINWVGGKRLLRKTIEPLIPTDIKSYIEPFGGGGWILFYKQRWADLEIYNDLDGRLVNLFRIVKYHPNAFKEEYKYLLGSREIFLQYLNAKPFTDIQRAVQFYFLITRSFGGRGETFGTVKKSCGGASKSQRNVLDKKLINQVLKFAIKDATKRFSAMGAVAAVPGLGEAVAIVSTIYFIYQIAAFYYQNKSLIDETVQNMFETFIGKVSNDSSYAESRLNKALEALSSSGNNNKNDDDDDDDDDDNSENENENENLKDESAIEKMTKQIKEIWKLMHDALNLTDAEKAEAVANAVGETFIKNGKKLIGIPLLSLLDQKRVEAAENKSKEKFVEAMDNGGCRPPKDPIILDLNNDGFLETTNIINGIYFDHENDGFAEASAWVGDNDGVLVTDSNNNGEIDNGSELLTAETLASFDTNEDGIIDENDTNFANLKILKGDGTLMTLTEAGITSINLNTTSTEITDENGNQQFASGTFTRADGTTGTFGEFLVKTETSNSIATEWLEETDGIAELPDISGSGNIYSLHQAMRHAA